jgi:hypothetical protein
MLDEVRQFINQHAELTEEEFRTLATKLHPVSFEKKTKLVGVNRN